MIRRAIPLLLLLLVAAEPVGADYAPPQAPPAPDPGPLLLRLFGMTLFVLLLCAAVLWFVRFAWRPRMLRGDGGGKLELLESAWLGRRCSVHLVQAGSCRVLIALDAGGMRTCQVVDDDFAGLLPVNEPREAPPPSVAEIMSLLAASRAAA
jgi:flagellar biogenesis protein FliO